MITIKEAALFCKDGDWIESKDQSPSGIRLIQTGNIGIGTYLNKISRAKYISEETFERLECTEVFPGDIVISRLPDPVGRACIVPDGLGRTITAVDCTILRVDEKKFLKEYVLLYSETEQYKAQIEKFLAGSTRVRISRKNLESISIPQKTFEIQKSIVSRIYKIKNIITLREQQLSKLDQLVKSRFIEMFGDPAKNPLGWDTKPFLSMGLCKNGINFHTGDQGIKIHCLGVSDFKDNTIIKNTEQLPTISLSETPPKESILHNGDIVFVRSNGNKHLVGRCLVVYPHNTPTTYSGFCIRYRLTSKGINIIYLLYTLKTDSMRMKISGRGANIQNLNQQILGTLNIPIPPINLQEQFATFVQQVDKVKSSIKQSLEKLETLKNSLMQEYFG